MSFPAANLVARLRGKISASASRTGWLRRQLIHELGKFGTVGATSYLVDLAVFNAFLASFGYMWSKVVSTAIAATLAFVGNKMWTWRHRDHARLHRAYALYFIFNAIGLSISLTCLWLSHDILGTYWPDVFRTRLADNISAMVVGMTLGTAFRFLSYRTFVFVAKDERPLTEPITENAWKG